MTTPVWGLKRIRVRGAETNHLCWREIQIRVLFFASIFPVRGGPIESAAREGRRNLRFDSRVLLPRTRIHSSELPQSPPRLTPSFPLQSTVDPRIHPNRPECPIAIPGRLLPFVEQTIVRKATLAPSFPFPTSRTKSSDFLDHDGT